MKISARILFFALIFLVGTLFFASRANAQEITPAVDQKAATQEALGLNPDVEPNLENSIQVIMIKTMAAMSCQITGINPISQDQTCLGVDPNTGKIGYVKDGGGAIAVMGEMISYTFIPPISSGQYIGYLKDNFGIAKPAYAQTRQCSGVGFCSIEPILGLWVVMRNFVYLIFILVFVIIGMAIMLRVHIDARTVMTVQNQIPKIIIGIVLVTFSFSIAGLLIDVMYFSSYLLGSVIADAPLGAGATTIGDAKLNEIITSPDPFQATHLAYDGGVLGIIGDSSRIVNDFIAQIFFHPDPNTGTAFDDKFAIDPLGIVEGLVRTFIGVLAFLIIGIAVIFVLIRLWVILIFSYVNILLDIIFAPFWFLMGLMPGGSMGYSAWFRDMLANLAVFPATVAMLMLTNYFGHAFGDAGNTALFSPPLLAKTQSAATISSIIALGFFFMMPNILTIMKGALKAPKVNFGPVFQPASVGGKIFTSTPKRLISFGERYAYGRKSSTLIERAFKTFGNPIYSGGHGGGSGSGHKAGS